MNEITHEAALEDDDPEGLPGGIEDEDRAPTRVQKGFGVRRVNNLPVIIGGAIVLGFAAVIAIVAAHRAELNAPKPPGAATAETVADKSNATQAEQMAATISRSAPKGVISPLGDPIDAIGVISPASESGATSASAATVANSEMTALQQERTRLLVLKRTQLEEAIRAPTSISSVTGRSGIGSTGMVETSYAGNGGASARDATAGSVAISPSMIGQLNGAQSQIERERLRAVESAHVLSARLNQLTRERGIASQVDAAPSGASPAGDGASNGYTIPAIPASLGTTTGPPSTARPGLLNEATAQFDSKEQDRWSLNSSMTVPRSPYELRAGAVIPAILISGISSELPGQIIAQLSENVYDTARGNSLLLPQGSRLIGEYTSNIGYGQGRLMVVWKRIVFPDAKALDIGTMPGTDAAGYAGMKDQVNNHYVRLFAGAIMLSVVEAAVVKSQPQYSAGLYPSTSQALDQSLGQQLGITATQLVQKNMNIAPTLNIRPGYRLNVMVTKDMVFSKAYQSFDY